VNLRVDYFIRTLPANFPIPTNNRVYCSLSSSTFRLRISFQVTIQDRVGLGKFEWVILGERSGRGGLRLPNSFGDRFT
jgi:hypothetical protein